MAQYIPSLGLDKNDFKVSFFETNSTLNPGGFDTLNLNFPYKFKAAWVHIDYYSSNVPNYLVKSGWKTWIRDANFNITGMTIFIQNQSSSSATIYIYCTVAGVVV
jgi:hypothetical protein